MKIEVVTLPPVTPPPKEIHVTLSEAEATFLLLLVGKLNKDKIETIINSSNTIVKPSFNSLDLYDGLYDALGYSVNGRVPRSNVKMALVR